MLVYLTSFGDIENDQLTGHFQSFFFVVPPTLNLKKKFP